MHYQLYHRFGYLKLEARMRLANIVFVEDLHYFLRSKMALKSLGLDLVAYALMKDESYAVK